MDIYQPQGDTATRRPVVILAFGGSFISGSRTSPDVVHICNQLARRGYVAVSIDYRTGISFGAPNQLPDRFKEAVWRAMQDGRAAIRFFRKDAQTSNLYKIDPNYIFIGGVSAGGIGACHVGYINKSSEFPGGIDTLTYGNFEGNSGNPGYSSRPKGVINLCGAIGDLSYLSDNQQTPIVSVHGNQDPTVPYKTNVYSFGGIAISTLNGSYVIDSTAAAYGIPSTLKTFKGQGHVPFVNSPATNLYIDRKSVV